MIFFVILKYLFLNQTKFNAFFGQNPIQEKPKMFSIGLVTKHYWIQDLTHIIFYNEQERLT
jgi:hypothetical protein